MASAPPGSSAARLSVKDLITLACAIIGAAFVIGGAIRSDGQREQRLQAVELDVNRLEQAAAQKADLLDQINIRTTRIETKLEMILAAKGAPR